MHEQPASGVRAHRLWDVYNAEMERLPECARMSFGEWLIEVAAAEEYDAYEALPEPERSEPCEPCDDDEIPF